MSVTHSVERVAAFDQFPYTHHLEGGVLLMKRPQPLIDTVVVSTDANELKIIETITTSICDNEVLETDEVKNKKRKAEDE